MNVTRPNPVKPRKLCTRNELKQIRFASDDGVKSKKGITWDRILAAQSKKKPIPAKPSRRICAEVQLISQDSNLIRSEAFDPLRSLQFLCLELKSKLKAVLPDDKIVHKILSEIQQTIKRLGTTLPTTPFTTSTSSSNLLQQSSLIAPAKKAVAEKSCQTKIPVLHSEEDIRKKEKEYEESRKSLENFCNIIKCEKVGLQKQVANYQAEVASLKMDIQKLQKSIADRTETEKNTSFKLEEQFQRLRNGITTFEDFARQKQLNDSQDLQEMTIKLKQSKEQISELERTKLESERDLALIKIEKEKFMILQKFREDQVKSLQKELLDLYALIKSQFRLKIHRIDLIESNNPNSSNISIPDFSANHVKTPSNPSSALRNATIDTTPESETKDFGATLESQENHRTRLSSELHPSKHYRRDKQQELQQMYQQASKAMKMRNKASRHPLSQSSTINLQGRMAERILPEQHLDRQHRQHQEQASLFEGKSIVVNGNSPDYGGNQQPPGSEAFAEGWGQSMNFYNSSSMQQNQGYTQQELSQTFSPNPYHQHGSLDFFRNTELCNDERARMVFEPSASGTGNCGAPDNREFQRRLNGILPRNNPKYPQMTSLYPSEDHNEFKDLTGKLKSTSVESVSDQQRL